MLHWILLATTISAAKIDCPEGTKHKQRKTVEASEQWCVTAKGVRHGPRHAWHQNGKQWFEGSYDNGQRTSVWRFWHDDGNKRSESTYHDDKRHGAFTEWHQGGTKVLAGQCKGGGEDGVWTRWWPNGKKSVEAKLVGGKLTGKAQYWSRRGQPLSLQEWVEQQTRQASLRERMLKEHGQTAGFVDCKD